MSKEVEARTRAFAIDVMRLCGMLPRRFEFQHIHSQLLRASSSVAANYRAAFRGRSKAEFIAKLGIAEEECDESQFWLELIEPGTAALRLKLPRETVQMIQQLASEADEITRILVASRRTAKSNDDRGGVILKADSPTWCAENEAQVERPMMERRRGQGDRRLRVEQRG